MNLDALRNTPHRRFNPLTRDWVLVSPHRTQRPWQGQVEKTAAEKSPQYDPDCYLCPGNSRAGGHHNPKYDSTFVFDNDFAALKPDAERFSINQHNLIIAEAERGICRVICFSPRHDLTLALMTPQEIRTVIDVWASQYQELGSVPWINSVQIFENRGAMMGASNPHPHCQVWANESLPNETSRELASLTDYRNTHGSCLLCDYMAAEKQLGARVVAENDHFLVVVPFWAIWPFETLLISKRHVADMNALTASERDALADILKRITIRYDNIFETSFPYSMGFHQRPTDGAEHSECHFHAHFLPPLLRSATVRKFMVGYELLGTPQRDITPESAAERLRDTREVHYTER
ncbi:MAG TPA: UDP-glucose--hexose-1-phosphate uridylyltransferase [Terriglobales bacterium]|nr:UDP-glucose--hexose-1-phosphate uridylyltransferase [Terriglobales bacterium]